MCLDLWEADWYIYCYWILAERLVETAVDCQSISIAFVRCSLFIWCAQLLTQVQKSRWCRRHCPLKFGCEAECGKLVYFIRVDGSTSSGWVGYESCHCCLPSATIHEEQIDNWYILFWNWNEVRRHFSWQASYSRRLSFSHRKWCWSQFNQIQWASVITGLHWSLTCPGSNPRKRSQAWPGHY